MTNIAIYVRTGSDTLEDAKVLAQLAACQAHAQHSGWTVVATYSDPRSSGSAEREGLSRLIADAEAGQFSAVLAMDAQRYARDLAQFAQVRHRLSRAGVSMLSVADGDLSMLEAGAPSLAPARAPQIIAGP